jgi:imidazolonepropionase-like amidohydrolase
LELLVTRGGLTPMEAITEGTRNAAAILNLTNMGTIAAGKDADFVVLDANTTGKHFQHAEDSFGLPQRHRS